MSVTWREASQDDSTGKDLDSATAALETTTMLDNAVETLEIT